jgi:hypothetical protein
MNSTSAHKKPFRRQVERRLIGVAMMVIAYLLERAMLRSIRRSSANLH